MAKRVSVGINVRDFRLKQLKRMAEERAGNTQDDVGSNNTGKTPSGRRSKGSHKTNTISVKNKDRVGPSGRRKGLDTAKRGFNKEKSPGNTGHSIDVNKVNLAERVREDAVPGYIKKIGANGMDENGLSSVKRDSYKRIFTCDTNDPKTYTKKYGKGISSNAFKKVGDGFGK